MGRPVGRAALAVQGSERGPRVRVAALMVHDGKVVTVRHRAGDSVYHLLPGGGVDYRETLETALRREIAEETGFEVEIGAPLFINDTIDPNGTRHLVNITFSATITGGRITDNPIDDRVEAVELVNACDLTSLDMRPPIAAELADWLSAQAKPAARYLGAVFTDGA